MKKFKASRAKVKFEYEFEDGEVVVVKYLEPTTNQIDKSVDIEDTKERLSYTKEVLKECLVCDEDVKEKLLQEQMQDSNIYEFKALLDEELANAKKRK